MLTSSPLTLPCLITWNSLVPLVVKVTTAAHVGSGRQQHELLNKTEAALKSPAVVRNDENIPNLAWIYNYAKSKFESLYWNFSIPIQSPGRELLWIICRDCVYLWESVCVIFFLPVFFLNADLRYFIMKLLWSPKTTTNELFWEVFSYMSLQ